MALSEVATAHKRSGSTVTATSISDRKSLRGPSTEITGSDGVNPLEFEGSVEVNDEPPTLETIRKIDNYTVLDKDGKSHTFRSLYTGRHIARRVLIIFIRHFFCGSCQHYIKTLSESITPQALLSHSRGGTTFICVIGCGDPALIDMYTEATGCPFPIYADPTRRLYEELGMIRTLALGPRRPDYIRNSLVHVTLSSVAQALKQAPKGLALRGGDAKQVGGEFLFEPVGGAAAVAAEEEEEGGKKPSPNGTPGAAAAAATAAAETAETPIGIEDPAAWGRTGRTGHKRSESSLDGKGEPDSDGIDKVVTWCHRMKHTRDHTEIPTLKDVLGLKDEPVAGVEGKPVKEKYGKSAI